MVKSSPEELAALRRAVKLSADGRCEWPYCTDQGRVMAHLKHRGMGGSRAANTIDNVVWLCDLHHDVLDGRVSMQNRRVELNRLLAAHVKRTRDVTVYPSQ